MHYDITIGDREARLLGDPHQGKTYKDGVPLHRRDEREQLSRDTFEASFKDLDGINIHICVGDMFDSFVVDNATVLHVAHIYQRAAMVHPRVTFVILQGNHDASRDTAKASSFDLLKKILAPEENIHVVSDYPSTVGNIAFVPWHPFRSAEEQIKLLPEGESYDAIVGHWDIQSYGGDDSNLIPIEEIAKRTKLAITGHIHLRQELEREGVRILVTGSMIPQAHGEDLTGDLFVTMSLEELDAADPASYLNKCLRVTLRPGEDLPQNIDALQVKVKRLTEEEKEVTIEEVEIANFNLQELWGAVAADNQLSLPQTDAVWGFLSARMETDSSHA
jgi:DNA repair exonuclease SbcCD nuclease subunit